ncbi:hypothetical protein O0L34_g9383 [Tuta absoluta]|nr:hypothetical protein O0L34_g9383 [Tuta absoluta]
MIAQGIWEITSVESCPNGHMLALRVDVERRKMNRTHYGFNCQLDFSEPMNSDLVLEITICKWVDGGCKLYQVLKDDSMGSFAFKIAQQNTKKALEMFGIEGGDFPIPAGQFELSQYMLDVCEFPCKSVLGTFTAETKVKSKMGQELGCTIVTVEFREPLDGEQICDKCMMFNE